ncbi:Reticulocyte-binding protein [Dirofilaria immitis]
MVILLDYFIMLLLYTIYLILSTVQKMSHNIEEKEEEEEEEEDEAPITLRKGTGFRMTTNMTPVVNQDTKGTLSNTDGQHTEIVHETVTTTHEVIKPQEQAQSHGESNSAETQAEELRQAKLRAENEAMEKAQQEALKRAQLAQQQAIKEAQERAQREAQMRLQQAQAEAKARQAEVEAKARQAEAEAKVRQAQAEAKAKQAEVEAKARQAEAEAKARQAEAEAKKRAEQEALRRAEREAQMKAERERAEQLRAQQQAKMKQAQQTQAQVQNLQQNQPKRQQPNQQQSQVPTRQSQIPEKQPQVMTKQPQIQATKYQIPTKQVQQTPPQQQTQQKKAPTVPTKPGQAPSVTSVVKGGPLDHKLSAEQDTGKVQRSRVPAAFAQQQTSATQLIPTVEDKIQVMRGGDVQQAYLNNLIKPVEILPQQEVKLIHTQDDQSWVTQNRIPVEIQAPQPAKITIPDLHGSVEVKPTVIVPRPAQTTRVEWNEFPQEEAKEMRHVPRIKAGEWHPENQGETVGAQSVRSAYHPGRIGNVWPPPQNENIAPRQEVTVTKTADDTAWRRDEKIETETGTAWSKTVPHNLREQRIWPPPENEIHIDKFKSSRLKTVQWPPPEFEHQIQQDVDTLQTRLPVKPHQRQWPPPPPEYRSAMDENEKMVEQTITKQMPNQQMQKRTAVTKETVRVGGGR